MIEHHEWSAFIVRFLNDPVYRFAGTEADVSSLQSGFTRADNKNVTNAVCSYLGMVHAKGPRVDD